MRCHLLTVLAAFLCATAPTFHVALDPDADFNPESCSLYCMAYPSESVSEHIPSQGKVHYDAGQIRDGEPKTAWVVKDGPTSWLEFTFKDSGFHPDFDENWKRTGVDTLYILNGYNKSPEHWRNHARIRELELSVNGSSLGVITLLDSSKPQAVTLPKTLLQRGMRFRFTVRSVYPGAKFPELAVSEARLDGYGHH
ncbi:MAG: hypothetical protein IT364_26730 [Candidatus Hydrogenedentes bacterium]|nr:hypothetical protein [Candidatus Hydrogenedentota bacterium]